MLVLPVPGISALSLIEGTDEASGYLLINYNGEWGSVCDDEFDNEEATYFCYLLGYAGSVYLLFSS